MSRKSRKLWQCNEEILLRIIDKRRTILVEHVDDLFAETVDIKQLKYYTLNTDKVFELLQVFISSQEHYEKSDSLGEKACDFEEDSFKKIVKSRVTLSDYSKCPNYIFINQFRFDLDDKASILDFIEASKPGEKISQLSHIMTKSGYDRSPSVEYIPEFTLTDVVERSMFHSYPRRIKQLEVAAQNYQKQDPFWDQTPFIKEIGVLRVEVKTISFLKHFFNTCDTKIRELHIIETPQITKDIFNFQEELSSNLRGSVQRIITNKWFEKSCRRFDNCQNFEVSSFSTLVNILMGRNKALKNIKFSSECISSTITIKNAFISLNKADSSPVFVDSISAHFSKEDVSIQGEGTYLTLKGNMIDIQGIRRDIKSEKLTKLIEGLKDESTGIDKIIVLVQNKETNEVLDPLRKLYKLPKQVFNISTSSKYVDIKIKKATCKIVLNSNSDLSLVHDEFNTMFIQFLKIFLNGR